MRRLGWASVVIAVAVAAIVFLVFPEKDSPQPADVLVPIDLPQNAPLHIAFVGTSLTASYDWPEQLQGIFDACLPFGATVSTVAKNGENIEWGLTQVARLKDMRPDVVFIEFAINDADLRDGLSLSSARARHVEFINALQRELADPTLILMTMNPAVGIRGWIRPWLKDHYAQYRALAKSQNVGLLDLYPRWLSRRPDEMGLEHDGLHPDTAIASSVILPAVTAYVSQAARQICEFEGVSK